MTGTIYEHNVTCYCGSEMKLRYSRAGKPFYGCSKFPECDGATSAHPDGTPMGRPADRETRRMRRMLHATMQGIWDYDDKEQRERAYAFLKENAPKSHVSMMNEWQCKKTIKLLLKRA